MRNLGIRVGGRDLFKRLARAADSIGLNANNSPNPGGGEGGPTFYFFTVSCDGTKAALCFFAVLTTDSSCITVSRSFA